MTFLIEHEATTIVQVLYNAIKKLDAINLV